MYLILSPLSSQYPLYFAREREGKMRDVAGGEGKEISTDTRVAHGRPLVSQFYNQRNCSNIS